MSRPNLTRSSIALVLSLGAHALGAVWLLHALPPDAPHAASPPPMVIEIRSLPARPTAPSAPKVPSRPVARAPIRALAPRAREVEAISVAAQPTVAPGEKCSQPSYVKYSYASSLI